MKDAVYEIILRQSQRRAEKYHDTPKHSKRPSMQESSLLLPTEAKNVDLYLSTPQGHNRAYLASAPDAEDGQGHVAVVSVPLNNPGTN